jgi:hypothetical protein
MDDWDTYDPEDIAERVPRERIEAGLEWVCGSVLSLPTGPDQEVMHTLGKWCAVNVWVRRLSPLESLPTAVANVPALADLLDEESAARGMEREDIADSLASAEYTVLLYDLTRRLTSLPDPGIRGLNAFRKWRRPCDGASAPNVTVNGPNRTPPISSMDGSLWKSIGPAAPLSRLLGARRSSSGRRGSSK